MYLARRGGGVAGCRRWTGRWASCGSPGCRPADAAFANHALGNYVAGAALWEAVGLGGATGESRAQRARAAGEAVGQVQADLYPGVAWAAGIPVRRDGRRPVRVWPRGAARRDRRPRPAIASRASLP